MGLYNSKEDERKSPRIGEIESNERQRRRGAKIIRHQPNPALGQASK